MRLDQAKRHCKKTKMSLTAPRQVLKNDTTGNANFAMRNSATMKTTKTKYAASLPAALYIISILFSDQQHSFGF